MTEIINPRPWGTDVSQHQERVDFVQLWRDGFDYVFVKMSEGRGYVDPWGEENLRAAIRNGLIPGAYHFLWGGMSVADQVEHFLTQIKKVIIPSRVMLALDVEVSSNMNPHQIPTFDQVKRFLTILRERVPGHPIVLYSGYHWRDNGWRVSDLGISNLRIWDAHYFTTRYGSAADLCDAVPNSYWGSEAFGGARADLLQFADTAVTTQYGRLDANATKGTYGDLRVMAGLTADKRLPLIRPESASQDFLDYNAERMARELEYRFRTECTAEENFVDAWVPEGSMYDGIYEYVGNHAERFGVSEILQWEKRVRIVL